MEIIKLIPFVVVVGRDKLSAGFTQINAQVHGSERIINATKLSARDVGAILFTQIKGSRVLP
jgi:hypothetical protein